ncbi:MAG: AraC family transcriptional regulator [Burkholderiales bacterium]|nr:AraC family transcriptional regulator [Burkholderiales bacterium]
MTTFSILTIGFSVLSAAILLIAYVFFLKNVNKKWYAVASCAGVLISMSALQLWHLEYFLHNVDVLTLPGYRFWLFLAPPMFYFFSRATLLPEAPWHPILLVHLLPLLLNFLPRYEYAIPVIFMLGMSYCFWISTLIFGLRDQRKRFKMEMFFFTLFSICALFVLVLGLSVPYVDHVYFYVFYTNSIGMSFALVVGALIVFPDVLTELAEAAKLSYAASTLKDVDIQANLDKLDELMKQSKLYQNENLSLAMVAEAMGLTAHQLSELVNRQFGVNFSRYIREQRVNAAKTILVDEPKSSVLSIGLEVGFGTQSNFYAAFKEITGMSPGAYRKSLSK